MRTRNSIGIAAILLTGMATTAWAQTPWPAHLVEDQNWTSGAHYIGVTPPILSPGSASLPVSVSDSAQVEFVSATSILLKEGLYAGDFSGEGFFEARIDTTLGPDADVVVVSPELAHHFGGSILHVNKWEKLEVGVRLPQEYRDAIDRFIDHYYSDSIPYVATPDSVDAVHDLNPYADDSLQLVMTLTSPSGAQSLKWGYFMREAMWSGTNDTSIAVEDTTDLLYHYHIRFRTAPDEEGDWQFSLSLNAPHTTILAGSPLPSAQYTGYTFHCDPPLPDNKGPLEVDANNRRNLQFADGTPYFGLGVNLEATGYGYSVPACGPNTAWADGNGYRLVWNNFLDVSEAMEDLRSVGGNFARVWLSNKTFAPENVNLGVYDRFQELLQCGGETIGNCTPVVRGNTQHNAWAFDQLLDTARQKGIYFQLCIVPFPPIIAYEPWAWKHDPYLLHFVEPRDTVTGLYDMKRYFFSNGDPTTADTAGSAFYYWKRKYKYIMNRWGWSVNIPIIEPFNEIDQMLTYHDVDLTDPHNANNCAENNLHWPADPDLPGIYSAWLSDIIHYVKDPVNLSDPANSSLGESSKLFLVGTGPDRDANNNELPPNNPDNPNWNLPNKNPDVDLVDVHHGMYWGEGELSNSYSSSQDFREAYTSSADGSKRPFHQGESNYYEGVDHDNNPNTDNYEAANVFDNYDVSFHNEIWASTFFGNFAAASTWHKGRVFWWMIDVEKNRPPDDDNNPFYGQFPRTAALGGKNALAIGNDNPPIKILIENRTLYHHFRPLTDFLENVALGSGSFFDQDHEPRKVYDDEGKLECYYLVNADSTSAIGWVHNLNAYWENHYYVNNQHETYLGCATPSGQSIALNGLLPGPDYQVTWFPTRMNMTALPADHEDTTQTGTVTLDLSSLPLNGIHSWPANDNLDTLRSDYAFMIHAQPVHRMVPVTVNDSMPNAAPGWDFGLYPNPTTGVLNVLLPSGPPVDLSILDMAGRQVLHLGGLSEGRHRLDLKNLVPGVYNVRATSGIAVKNKLLTKR